MGVVRLNVPNTPPAPPATPPSPVVVPQEPGARPPGAPGVIALGAAGIGTNHTGRIVWSDNAVLNSTPFNTDTGVIRHVYITNNLALDAFAIGYVGTHSTRTPFMQNYQISGNSFRFAGQLTVPNYRNYQSLAKPDGTRFVSVDPGLRPGRHAFPEFGGLKVQGIARDIRLTDNWFTTRSREEFGSLNPLFSREPEYRIVYRLPARDRGVTNSPPVFRGDALEVDLEGNRISTEPLDFAGMQPLRGGRLATLTEGSSPLMELREALKTGRGFAPMGALERVEMVFTNVQRRIPWKGVPFGTANTRPSEGSTEGLDRVLIGAIEVLCGVPLPPSGGEFRLPVRVAFQPTPRAGIPGTAPLGGRQVHLEVLPGSLHTRRLTATTGADGVAVFSWPVPRDANGVDRIRAWTDGGSGRAGEWDEYQDAWATAHVSHGQTVDVLVEFAVADAQNDHAGRVRLRRNGPADRPLTVRIGTAEGPQAAQAGTDFRLMTASSGRGSRAEAVGSTVAFARGQQELTLDIVPVRDKARSGRLVTLSVLPGDGYAPGEPPEGVVAVFAPK